MNEEKFNRLITQNYSHIPLVRAVLADFDTPLSAYLKVANEPNTYLFESVQGGEKWGRYSIIGLQSETVIKVNKYHISVETAGKKVQGVDVQDPLEWIENYQKQFAIPEIEGLDVMAGGLVGYFGYETIGYIEPKLANFTKEDLHNTPDILLMVSDRVIIFDNLSGKLYIVVYSDEEHGYQRGVDELDRIETLLLEAQIKNQPSGKPEDKIVEADFISGFTEQGYKNAVDKARQYIIDGDIMQVVLSQRLTVPFKAEPIDLYRALRCLNPSPYMYFMHLDGFHIVGSSPEILVRLQDDEVTVRPIAGTRPRGKTEAEDQALEVDLLSDAKELAEHLMLIDLGRNDAGRVSQTGTVELTDKMLVERYSHVMHIVSNVTGKLNKELSVIDVLRATFPAGTVSGAPKIRAMEIIDELEPIKRGVYSGAVGYLSFNGDMDVAIAIRTAVIKDEILSIQAGAGIVYDSVPDNEWVETINKARAVMKAAETASSGLPQQTHLNIKEAIS